MSQPEPEVSMLSLFLISTHPSGGYAPLPGFERHSKGPKKFPVLFLIAATRQQESLKCQMRNNFSSSLKKPL